MLVLSRRYPERIACFFDDEFAGWVSAIPKEGGSVRIAFDFPSRKRFQFVREEALGEAERAMIVRASSDT